MTNSVGCFETPKGKSVAMEYREGTNDWNVLYATLNEDEYGIGAHSFDGFALDIGAHIGGVSVGLAADNPDLLVLAVEPVPENVDVLRRNLARNDLLHRVLVRQAAAGAPGVGSTVVYYDFKGSAVNEHHAWIGLTSNCQRPPSGITHESASVPVLSLTQMLDGRVAVFAKVDCEGAEYGLFKDREAIKLVERYVGEWHPANGLSRDDLVTLLGPTHDVTFTGPEGGPGSFVAERLV